MKIEDLCKQLILGLESFESIIVKEAQLHRMLRIISNDICEKPTKEKIEVVIQNILIIRQLPSGKGVKVSEQRLTNAFEGVLYALLEEDYEFSNEMVNAICDFAIESSLYSKQGDFFSGDRKRGLLGIFETLLMFFPVPESLGFTISVLLKSKNRVNHACSLRLIEEYFDRYGVDSVEGWESVFDGLGKFVGEEHSGGEGERALRLLKKISKR